MSQPIKSDELFASWSRNQWKSVYLFAGQEDFLIEQAVQQAGSHWLAGDSSGLNWDRLDGNEHGADEILEACRTAPFLGKARVISVQNAFRLSAQDQELLAEALPRLPPDVFVLFIWGKEWRRDELRKPLVEATLNSGSVVIFWPLFPEQAQRWVIQRVKTYKKTITDEAAVWLVQEAGEGLRMLDQELAKASVYVGNRPAVEMDDIRVSFGYAKACSPFEWLNALRQKNTRHALPLLDRLLEEGEEPLRLLAMVSRALRDWLAAKESGESASVLAMRFHIRRGEENRFVQDLARWKEEDLVNAIGRCLEAEQAIKSGKETPEMAMTLLTLGFSGLEPAHTLR